MSRDKNTELQAGLARLKSEMDSKKNLALNKPPLNAMSGDVDGKCFDESPPQQYITNTISNRFSNSSPKNSSNNVSNSLGMLGFLMPGLGLRTQKDNYSFYIKVSNKERLDLLANWNGWGKSSPLLDGLLSNLFDSLGEEFWIRIEQELKTNKEGES